MNPVGLRKFRIEPPRKIKTPNSALACMITASPYDMRLRRLALHMYCLASDRRINITPDLFMSNCSAKVRSWIQKAVNSISSSLVDQYKVSSIRVIKRLYINEKKPKGEELQKLREKFLKLNNKVPEIAESLQESISSTYAQINRGEFDDIINKRLATPFYEFIELIKNPTSIDADSQEFIETFYSLFKLSAYKEFDIEYAGKALYECSQELSNTSVQQFVQGLLDKDGSVDLRDVLTVCLFLKMGYEDSIKYNLRVHGGNSSLRRKMARDKKWLDTMVEKLSEKVEGDPKSFTCLVERTQFLDEVVGSIRDILKLANSFSQ